MPDLRGAVQQGLIRQVHGTLVIRQKRRPGERRWPMETIYMALFGLLGLILVVISLLVLVGFALRVK